MKIYAALAALMLVSSPTIVMANTKNNPNSSQIYFFKCDSMPQIGRLLGMGAWPFLCR